LQTLVAGGHNSNIPLFHPSIIPIFHPSIIPVFAHFLINLRAAAAILRAVGRCAAHKLG
jgi:hypothetical protein